MFALKGPVFIGGLLHRSLVPVMLAAAVRAAGVRRDSEVGVFGVNKDLKTYRRFGNRLVDGWLAPEVLEILAILDSVQRSAGIAGAVSEIGVHHGRLFIGLNLLQLSGEHSVAIDLFEDQDRNVEKSGKGDRAAFLRNVKRWSCPESVVIHSGDSTELNADEVRKLARGGIRMFSVDGGHTDSIVFSDMNLAEASIVPGGIVIADDVFNQDWPGVVTGTMRYMRQGGQMVPFAIGFNKTFFCLPAYVELYVRALEKNFGNRYMVYVKASEFASSKVLVIGRVRLRPRPLLSRSDVAKGIYRRAKRWRMAIGSW